MPIYSDLNFDYGTTATDIGRRVLDEEAVLNSLTTILSTIQGEMFFCPELGSAVEELLFEPIDEITATTILTEIVSAVERWDNRIVVNYERSFVIPDEDGNSYRVHLSLSIRGLDEIEFAGKFARTVGTLTGG